MEFVGVFGAAWARLDQPHDFDADPEPELLDSPPWYVAGDPAQLMLRVDRNSFELAMPRGTWLGTSLLVLRPHEATWLPIDQAHDEVTRDRIAHLLHRRPSSFIYCRYCRVLATPEACVGNACMGCAASWEGIVY